MVIQAKSRDNLFGIRFIAVSFDALRSALFFLLSTAARRYIKQATNDSVAVLTSLEVTGRSFATP